MEDSVTAPCPRAASQMAAFDALPGELRAFIAGYPRGLKSVDRVLAYYRQCGDVEDVMHEITCVLPVRRA